MREEPLQAGYGAAVGRAHEMVAPSPRIGASGTIYDWAQILALLEEIANAIDVLWNEARNTGAGGLDMTLADASYGVHRALISLRDAGSNSAR